MVDDRHKNPKIYIRESWTTNKEMIATEIDCYEFRNEMTEEDIEADMLPTWRDSLCPTLRRRKPIMKSLRMRETMAERIIWFYM